MCMCYSYCSLSVDLQLTKKEGEDCSVGKYNIIYYKHNTSHVQHNNGMYVLTSCLDNCKYRIVMCCMVVNYHVVV
jgi:hypothetical protein